MKTRTTNSLRVKPDQPIRFPTLQVTNFENHRFRMPTSNAEFNDHTAGYTVVSAYPDQVKNKIILVTGANPGGIGESTAVSLAKASPKLIIVAGRSSSKLAATAEGIKETNPNVAVKQLILDLSSQESCRKAAHEILEAADIPAIHILVNNAGVMVIPERTLSPEGIEMQFATNHVGHYLFTNLILPKIMVAAKTSPPGSARIINLSSRAVMNSPVRFSDWNFTKPEAELPQSDHLSKETRKIWGEMEDRPYVPQAAYGQSKSANVLFTRELNKRLFEKTGILSIAVHPGVIDTNLGRHLEPGRLENVSKKFKEFYGAKLSMKDLDQGCSTTLVAALDPKITPDDFFMAGCQVANWAPDYASSEELAGRLWTLSEGLVRQQFLN